MIARVGAVIVREAMRGEPENPLVVHQRDITAMSDAEIEQELAERTSKARTRWQAQPLPAIASATRWLPHL